MPCAVFAVGASCARDLYTCQLWRDTTLRPHRNKPSLMRHTHPRQLQFYRMLNGREPFTEWYATIQNNTDLMCISPIPIKRRELHRQQESKGRKRSRVGGTVLGKGNLVKNTLIKHVKYGLTRLAGVNAKGLFSVYNLEGKRLTTGAKRSDFRVLTRLNFYYRNGVSSPE